MADNIQQNESVDSLPSEDIFVDTEKDDAELVLPTVRLRATEGPDKGRIAVFDKKTEEFIRFEDDPEDIGPLEAAGRGVISGLTSRLAPLAVGAVEAPLQQIKDVLELVRSGVRPSEFTPEQREQLSQFLEQRTRGAFEEGTAESARRFEQARQQFPGISGTAELAGGIGQAFAIPGGGASRAIGAGVTKATGGRLLGAAARLGVEAGESAIFGGLEALGTQSEALAKGDTEQALEAAKQTAGVSAVLGPVLSRGVVPLAKATGATVGSIKNALADVSPSAISFLRKNTDLVNNAKTSGELADRFANRFKELSDNVLEESQALKQGLSDQPQINRSAVDNIFDRLIKETDTEGQKTANRKLIAFKDDVQKRFDDIISEQDLKDIVDDLNTFAFSGSTIITDNVTKNSIRRASRQANEILKDANPEFASVIGDVENKLNALENFENKFALKAEPGRQIEAQDSTVQKIRNTLNPDKISTTRAVDQLDEAFGTDLGKQARATAAAEDLRIIERPVKKGIQAGGLVRELTTAIAGRSIVGGERLLGPTLEFIDKNLGKLGQFRKPLEDAAKRGPQALASTFFVMSNNPEFRKAIKDAEEEEEQQ